MSPLLRVGEVGAILGLSKSQVFALVREGRLPSIKVGGARRFSPEDVAALIAAGRDRKPAQPRGLAGSVNG
jgi:excisionase family DNA binding protein